MRTRRLVIIVLAAILSGGCADERPVDDPVRVAVAANFAGAFAELAEAYRLASGVEVESATGATGVLYAQIRNGAPFDAYLAADAARPERLEADGVAVAGSRFTYAVGVLALWTPHDGVDVAQGRCLTTGDVRRLSMANPDLAPYGRAAAEALVALGLDDADAPTLVRAANVGQAFQFTASGAVDAGLVAAPQVAAFGGGGSLWIVPRELHAPIEQQAVLLSDDPRARGFLDFVRGAAGRAIIADRGYRLAHVEEGTP